MVVFERDVMRKLSDINGFTHVFFPQSEEVRHLVLFRVLKPNHEQVPRTFVRCEHGEALGENFRQEA